MKGDLRVICIDAEAPPLFHKSVDGCREGYEPEVAVLAAEVLGLEVRWEFRPWGEMIEALRAGEGDVVWCGQGITDERRKLVDFTEPYAVFDESVLVRAGEDVSAAEDLRGRTVGAIAGSTNMALAETFQGAVAVPFSGASGDVFGEMIGALRAGAVDAIVDDDVALVPLDADEDLRVAFTVPTRNEWGVAVAKDRPELRDRLNSALRQLIADGRLAGVWSRWMPQLAYPFEPRR